MTTLIRLGRWTELLQNKLARALREQDIEAVATWSNVLGICIALTKEASGFEERLAEFELLLNESSDTTLRTPPTSDTPPLQLADSPKLTTSQVRLEASFVRDEWVRHLREQQKITLNGRGKIFQTASNQTVGIALANELPGIANKWFLGLPDVDAKIIVLLCRTADKKMYDIVIPVAHISVAWSLLARSNRQVKAHIKKEGNDFYLLVPRSNPISVTHYVGQYEPLQ